MRFIISEFRMTELDLLPQKVSESSVSGGHGVRLKSVYNSVENSFFVPDARAVLPVIRGFVVGLQGFNFIVPGLVFFAQPFQDFVNVGKFPVVPGFQFGNFLG